MVETGRRLLDILFVTRKFLGRLKDSIAAPEFPFSGSTSHIESVTRVSMNETPFNLSQETTRPVYTATGHHQYITAESIQIITCI